MKEETLVEIRSLKKWFPRKKSVFAKVDWVRAVDGISFDIKTGEMHGLLGESGCGKTTTGRLIIRLVEPTSGNIYYKGKDVASLKKGELKDLRREMQMIFQDPYSSMTPLMNVCGIITEPLIIHGVTKGKAEREKMAIELLEAVDLTPPEEFLEKMPYEMSGGERQRVAICRSLILKPKFIVADEPVSMLDVSIKAGILNLMLHLKETLSFTCLFITHDLAVARYICDRISVMYLGKIVESSPTDTIIEGPLHPYTKALMLSVPSVGLREKREVALTGNVPDPINLPPGCRFHPRCKYAKEICLGKEPELREIEKGHYVACHRAHQC